MANHEVDADLLERVGKILTLAERASTQGEAEAAYARATALMQKYSIDQAMLDAARGATKDEITTLTLPLGSTYWQATREVITLLGEALGFRTILIDMSRKNGTIRWFGWKSELEMAKVLWASVSIQIARAAKDHMNQSLETDREERFKEKRSFMVGYGKAVALKIAEQRLATRIEESQARGSSALLPALVSRDEQVDQMFDMMFRNKVTINNAKIHLGGYGAGLREGKNADIGQPRVGGSRGALGEGNQ